MISRISTSIIILLSLFSCKSYEVMYFDVLRPAQYSVSPTIKSIVIVDNAYPYNPDNAHIAYVMGEMVRLDTVKVDTFTTVVIGELKKELERRRFFDTVFVDTLKYNRGSSGKPYRQLTPAQIVDICSQYNADALLSLAGAEYGTAITVEDMGTEYYATMDVSGQVYWRLFDGYSAEGLHANLQRDTLYWDGVGVDVAASVGAFPPMKEAAIEVAAYLGATFTDELVPHWEQITRKVYIAGNVHFVNAAEWLAKDNRFEAEKLWGFVYEHGNSREKGKAANNIAVSLETRGELKLAMEWAYKSYEAFQAKGVTGNVDERRNSKELYLDMVRRYRDVKKLDEQIGGVE